MANKVTCGEKVSLCTENQEAYTPQGSKHRAANPAKSPEAIWVKMILCDLKINMGVLIKFFCHGTQKNIIAC